MMNISELQKTNNEKITNQAELIKKSTSQNQQSSEFVAYVESAQNQNASEQSQPENQDSEKSLEQQNLLNQLDEQTNAYIQSFQALNNEIFDLGFAGLASKKYNFGEMENYNINLTDFSLNDIKFFESLTQNKNDLILNSFNSQSQSFNLFVDGENIDISYKSLEISKTLFSALENAAKTGKSVRLDFGNDTSVILRINKDGKLSADFVPNEKAMETVLKNALPLLKAKLDEQNLPYSEINYKPYKQKEDNHKQNKEKNKDE